ncbi:hypothetical protein N0V90_013004 [Kalmusia sp. IMI 367209]|nr:hypothetical protein N0V90_013004 [Kalmusia sp. IMI 367209]
MATPVVGEIEPNFSTLGPRMSLFTPIDPTPGELIILCTWLGAGKKHIAKYVGEHRKIAPRAKILLIQSSVWIITARYTKQWEAIEPAAQVVRAAIEECEHSPVGPSVKPNIAIHTFSNGVPISGIICDSGPARGTYWKDYHSMLTSLPRGVFWQIVGHPVIFMTCNVLFGSQLLGWEKPESIYRRTLLDENVIACRRICYIFSEADTHVECVDVTTHAEIAEQKGWDVTQVLFEDTPHCNHISKYRAEYVDAMKRSWEAGLPALEA